VPQARIELDGHRCARCGHVWVPRKPDHPRVCPRCKSPFWDRERTLATFRIEADLRASDRWPPDATSLRKLERQLGGLTRVKKGGRSPEVSSLRGGIRVTFDLQAQAEQNAVIAARAMIDGRVRALGLRRQGYRSEVRADRAVIPRAREDRHERGGPKAAPF
jgi:hypothetical protein